MKKAREREKEREKGPCESTSMCAAVSLYVCVFVLVWSCLLASLFQCARVCVCVRGYVVNEGKIDRCRVKIINIFYTILI